MGKVLLGALLRWEESEETSARRRIVSTSVDEIGEGSAFGEQGTMHASGFQGY